MEDKLWYLHIFSEVRLVEILDGVCRHSDYDVSTILASYMHVYAICCVISHVTYILSAIGFWRIMKKSWRFGGSNCKSNNVYGVA